MIDELDGGALAQTNMWTINGSHHDVFPRECYNMHEKCLKPHVKTFSSQIVPYGHLEIADADFGYVVTILSMTIGPYKHKDLLQSDELAKIQKRANAEDSDYESEPEQNTMDMLKKNGQMTGGGGGGGGQGGYANADKAIYNKKNKDGTVRKHSRKCRCEKCELHKKSEREAEEKANRTAKRLDRAAKNEQVRAKNQLTIMVRNAVIACKAAKAAAIDAADVAENLAERSRHDTNKFLAG